MKQARFFTALLFLWLAALPYAIDVSAAEEEWAAARQNPAAWSRAFIRFALQKQRKVTDGRRRQNARERQDSKSTQSEREHEMAELIKMISSKGLRQRMHSAVPLYIERKLLGADETASNLFSEILRESPVQIPISYDAIQILTVISLSERPVTAKQEEHFKRIGASAPQPRDMPKPQSLSGEMYSSKNSGGGVYYEGFSYAAIEALAAISRHKALPQETLLTLTQIAADMRQNGYAVKHAAIALGEIGKSQPLFFPEISHELESMFSRTGFSAVLEEKPWVLGGDSRINSLVQFWQTKAFAARSLGAVSAHERIPGAILKAMAAALPESLNTELAGQARDLDLADRKAILRAMSGISPEVHKRVEQHYRDRADEALEELQHNMAELKSSIAASLKEIGRRQALPQEALQSLKRAIRAEADASSLRALYEEVLEGASEAAAAAAAASAASEPKRSAARRRGEAACRKAISRKRL